ncbi:MAG: hypothetical protein ACI9CA_000122 [Natronomonas sp.]|jgi:hypothetical protein
MGYCELFTGQSKEPVAGDRSGPAIEVTATRTGSVYYLTRGLQQTLLRLAREAEPDSTTISLSVTRAGEFETDTGLNPETPVFTHFYMPGAGGSVNAVFGVDLGTPVGQTEGRFVSHPDGSMGVSKLDDLHEVVFVAVPPWDEDGFGAFDRRGARKNVTVIDAEPPAEEPGL